MGKKAENFLIPHPLRRFRKKHRLTQAQLGRMLGRGHAIVSLWESNKPEAPSWVYFELAELDVILSNKVKYDHEQTSQAVSHSVQG